MRWRENPWTLFRRRPEEAGLKWDAVTGPGGRPENEDAFGGGQRPDGRFVAALADGLGGHGGGRIASDAAVRTLCAWDGRADSAALQALFSQAQAAVRAQQTASCRMKTTAVALLLEGSHAAWAHVGDSRLYHFADGKLAHQTLDHSASRIAVMLGQIRESEIRGHADRSRLLRALGQEDEPRLDAHEEDLKNGTHDFLLCSDGFWEYVLEKEMARALRRADSPHEALERMLEHLRGRAPRDNDNYTAVLVRVRIGKGAAEKA